MSGAASRPSSAYVPATCTPRSQATASGTDIVVSLAGASGPGAAPVGQGRVRLGEAAGDQAQPEQVVQQHDAVGVAVGGGGLAGEPGDRGGAGGRVGEGAGDG